MKLNRKILAERLSGWDDYIGVTATTVAETFFSDEYQTKYYQKCVRCGKVTIRTKDVLELVSQFGGKIRELLIANFTTVVTTGKHRFFVCGDCYQKEKKNIQYYQKAGRPDMIKKILKSIRVKSVETKEYKKVRMRAYTQLEKLFKEGFFSKKVRFGGQNLYVF